MNLEPMLIVSDAHRPFHDKIAWKLMLQVGRFLKPKHLVTIGDLADFYSVSSHSKDPGRTDKLMEEVMDVRQGLDELDALGATNKVFVAGNHCLAMDHTALTPNGFKSATELSVGDLVATRNPAGRLEWQPIERLIIRAAKADEKLYVYDTHGTSIACTDQHNVVGHSNGITWRRPASEVPDTFDLITSVSSGQVDYNLSDADIVLSAWASTDVHYHTKHSGVTFYQSEGKDNLVREALIASGFDYTELVRWRNITKIMNRVLKSPPKTHYEFRLSAKEGVRLRNLTGLNQKGSLPAWVSQLSDRQFKLFLSVLILADGSTHATTGTSHMFYGKEELCKQVQCAAVTHGWRASISRYGAERHYRVNLVERGYCRVDGWRAAAQPSDGDLVWCLTIANGNFLTERNGRVHVTGNCDRLTRYLQDKAPELFGMISIPAVLGLEQRKWKYVPYKSATKVGKMWFTHDVGVAGRNSSFKAMDKFQHSVVTGHAHRMQYIVEGNAIGECKLSAQFGWLGDASKVDYMQRINVNTDWALGFGVAAVNPASGIVYVTPVPVVPVGGSYTCVVNGKLFEERRR